MSENRKGMKKTKLIAVSGIIAALSVVVMLAAYFPWFTYAMPALAGCFLIVLVFDTGKKHAFVVFIVTSILAAIVCEKEAALSYALFFGYYPIIKALIEKIPSRVLEWVVKTAIFNVAFGSILLIATFIMGIDSSQTGEFGKYTIVVLAASGNLMFILYDIALSKFISLYAVKYRKKIKKYIG